jgi:hypothetical protein
VLTTKLSGQNSLRQPQTLSAQLSYTKDIPQQDIMNRAQALTTIASLHPELPNFQPHESLPSPPTTRQVTAQTDNLTHDHAFHASPAPYYQNQQNLQTLDEVHQGLGLQLQQQEQQQQQQELFEEIIEPQWDFDGFDYYQFRARTTGAAPATAGTADAARGAATGGAGARFEEVTNH